MKNSSIDREFSIKEIDLIIISIITKNAILKTIIFSYYCRLSKLLPVSYPRMALAPFFVEDVRRFFPSQTLPLFIRYSSANMNYFSFISYALKHVDMLLGNGREISSFTIKLRGF